VTSAEHKHHAKSYLAKAADYLASAEDNLTMERPTPAAGDAIQAGISAKDAILTTLTGTTPKRRDHAAAALDLRQALGQRSDAIGAERALRELVAAKPEVEYGTTLITMAKAEPLVRRARALVELARQIVQLGR
jgi:HEPN domain-containing protein